MADIVDLTPEEHQEMLKDFVPDTHGIERLWSTGFLATLGLHLAMISLLVSLTRSVNPALPFALAMATIIGVSAQILHRRDFSRSSSVGALPAVLLVAISLVSPLTVLPISYAIVCLLVIYAEARSLINLSGASIYIFYSAILLGIQPPTPLVASVACVSLGLSIVYAFVRGRRKLIVPFIGSALVYVILSLNASRTVFQLALILLAFASAFFLEFRGVHKERSDFSLFLGGGLTVLTAAATLMLFKIFDPMAHAVVTTLVVTALLVFNKTRSPALIGWISISWLLACWGKVEGPWLIWDSLALCAVTAYFGTWKKIRFLQVIAWILCLPLAGSLYYKDQGMFSLFKCAGAANFCLFACVVGATLFDEDQRKWWHGIIPATLYHPGITFLRAFSIRLGKLPFISGAVSVIAIPISWIRSPEDSANPFTLRSTMILSGHLIGAIILAKQSVLYIAGSSFNRDVGVFISVVVWTLWGAALSSWGSVRAYPLFRLVGIVFILWPLVYDLTIDHFLVKNLLFLSLAVVGAGLWSSGLWGTVKRSKLNRVVLLTEPGPTGTQ